MKLGYGAKVMASELGKRVVKIEHCLTGLWKVYRKGYLRMFLKIPNQKHKQNRSVIQSVPRVGELVLLVDEDVGKGK